MRRVAILGWGSLLWCRKNLQNEGRWKADGPWLPIEFARTSNLNAKDDKRRYLSLVLHATAGLIRTYWDISLLSDPEEACRDLKKRERCNRSAIASLPRRGQTWSSAVPGLEGRIQEWLASKSNEIDVVIWTNLPPKPENAPIETNIQWLESLRKLGRDDTAQEYIRKAPSQTDTCLRGQVRERFGWTDISIGL